MEVVFKLTPEQLARAKAVVKEIEAEGFDNEDKSLSWCGNLLGECGHSFSFNCNQHLELNQDAGTVTYEGERYPLVQDGALTVLYKIVAGEVPKFPGYSWETHLRKGWYDGQLEAVKQLRVVLYKTSDSRLRWWETMDDMAARMSPEELLEELLTGRKTGGWNQPPAAMVGCCRPFLEKYRGVEPGTPAYRRMVASGQQVEWRIAKILSKTH